MTSSATSYTIVFTDSGLGGLSIMADFINIANDKSLNLMILILYFSTPYRKMAMAITACLPLKKKQQHLMQH